MKIIMVGQEKRLEQLLLYQVRINGVYHLLHYFKTLVIFFNLFVSFFSLS